MKDWTLILCPCPCIDHTIYRAKYFVLCCLLSLMSYGMGDGKNSIGWGEISFAVLGIRVKNAADFVWKQWTLKRQTFAVNIQNWSDMFGFRLIHSYW